MNGLFGDNIFFLFLFACITIMNYSRMTENQKIILFYLLTFGLAILKVISIMNSIFYLSIVSFFYLEFLTEDTVKIKFVKKLRYKIVDFLFLMVAQYKFFLFFMTLVFTSTRVQNFVVSYLEFDKMLVNSFMDLFAILLFFITVFEISKEKFKIKTFTRLLNEVFIPPINDSELDIYEEYLDILVRIEDKTYFIRENSYNVFTKEFILVKLKQYANQNRKQGIRIRIKNYVLASQHLRGYSSLEMQLLRTVALDEGYYKTITRKIYEILYTNIIFKSMKEYYEKNDYVKHERFKEYLLSIYVSNVRTKIDGVVFTKMTKYLGENPMEWNKEKFYLACLGLTFQPEFTDFYVHELYSDFIKELELDIKLINQELVGLSKSDRNYYGGDK